jgi:hypothetical protein
MLVVLAQITAHIVLVVAVQILAHQAQLVVLLITLV